MRWERITSEGKTVWWRYTMSDVRWLSVSKVGRGEWMWKDHVRPGPHQGATIVAAGVEATMPQARRTAVLACDPPNPRCPNGCRGRLDWLDDQWYCARCGDEWHPEQFIPLTEEDVR